jgi:hypothetical protein
MDKSVTSVTSIISFSLLFRSNYFRQIFRPNGQSKYFPLHVGQSDRIEINDSLRSALLHPLFVFHLHPVLSDRLSVRHCLSVILSDTVCPTFCLSDTVCPSVCPTVPVSMSVCLSSGTVPRSVCQLVSVCLSVRICLSSVQDCLYIR